MSDFIHMNHGDASKRSELMRLLNTSFGFDTPETEFEGLLPKLYNEEYKPAENNIILDVNGEMRAAVGLYYNTLTVCGEELKTGGIGNVACHPNYRSMGYMRFCMAYALDEMKQNMTDFSFLCGKRQRYERYGYTMAGFRYEFTFMKENVSRIYGKDKKSAFTARPIEKSDSAVFKEISEIYNSRDFKAERNAENMYDILLSWHGKPYAVFLEDEFKGWFVLNGGEDSALEIGYKNKDDIAEIVICALETSGKNSIDIRVPPFDKPLSDYLALNCEWYDVGHPDFYNIFCYERVIRAFLKLKATYTKLADGELNMLVEGSKLPEQIKIKVENGKITVEETTDKPDIALTHMEAMRLVGSLYSEKRSELKPECASWFPLPLFTYSQDNV